MVERAGLGARSRQMVVPAQSGRAVSVRRGDLVRVVDIDGHQVGDMWAVDATGHGRWLSVSHTRDRCERLFPALGGQFCDQRGKPVLELVGDTSPGAHDMLFPPRDRWLYQSRGLAGHPTAGTTSWPPRRRPGSSCRSCPTLSTCSRTPARDLMARWLSAWPPPRPETQSPSSPGGTSPSS